MREYKKDSYKNWNLYRERINSINYVSKDEKYIMKVVKKETPEYLQEVEEEFKMYQTLASLGIPTPEVKDIYEYEDGKHGIVYAFVQNKVSISRGIGQDPTLVDDYMGRFVKVSKIIHDTVDKEHKLPKLTDRIQEGLKKYPNLFTPEQRKKVDAFLATIPEDDHLLHCDYHLANFITKTDTGETYAIDTAMFARGYYLFDIGLLYNFLFHLDSDVLDDFFHMNGETRRKCWLSFIKQAFNLTDPKEILAFEKKIKPYGLCSFIGHTVFLNTTHFQDYTIEHHFNEIFE